MRRKENLGFCFIKKEHYKAFKVKWLGESNFINTVKLVSG